MGPVAHSSAHSTDRRWSVHESRPSGPCDFIATAARTQASDSPPTDWAVLLASSAFSVTDVFLQRPAAHDNCWHAEPTSNSGGIMATSFIKYTV